MLCSEQSLGVSIDVVFFVQVAGMWSELNPLIRSEYEGLMLINY